MTDPGQHILLSRTDAIGDMVLTLPMAGFLKERFPEVKISVLGSDYTRDVAGLSQNVDEFISYNRLAAMQEGDRISFLKNHRIDTVVHVFPRKDIAVWMKKAGIKTRIGTSHRPYHLFTCNHRPSFSRKKSELHESQLNFKLLAPLTGDFIPELSALQQWFGFKKIPPLSAAFQKLLSTGKKNVILHPKSKGSAREWGLDNFARLIRLLPPEKFQIFLSGTEEEGMLFRQHLAGIRQHVTDLSGQMTLKEFIAFIARTDALVAASTGPLHIAAALGKQAIGIYPPIRPMHPGRWAPIGPGAIALSIRKECSECRHGGSCHCMTEIKPEMVKEILVKPTDNQ